MSRRSSATFRGFLQAAIAVAILVEGCGSASSTSSPAPQHAPTTLSPSARTGASPSAAVSGPPGPSATADPCGSTPAPTVVASPSAGTGASPSAAVSDSSGASATATAAATEGVTIGLPHVDAALEKLLPSAIGGIDLCKFSMTLSAYVDSSPGGDKYIYRAWLVKSGKTPDEVDIAIAAGLTENIVVHAIRVPGVSSATLTSRFADAARGLGWPVSSRTDLPKPVLVVTDQNAQGTDALSIVYVYAKNDVLYVVVTDDMGLLFQGLASLP